MTTVVVAQIVTFYMTDYESLLSQIIRVNTRLRGAKMQWESLDERCYEINF